MINPGSRSAFQFILKVLDRGEVRALRRPVRYFLNKFQKTIFIDPASGHGGVVMLEITEETLEKVFISLFGGFCKN